MELKFRVDGFEAVVSRLAELGVSPGEEMEEENVVLDRMGAPLGKRDVLFRLRTCGDGETLVTVKKPLPATALKVRLEEEAVLDCPLEEAQKLFALLGYGSVYRYSKKRRECDLEGVRVCLDELWFGRFIEVEASSEEEVLKAVRLLGLDPGEGIRFSYAALEREAAGP